MPMTAPPPQPGYEPARVIWLSVAQLITWGSIFYGFSLLLEPVERALSLTRAQSSLAFSLALLTEGLLALPVGRLIDAGHERAVMTGGSLLAGLALILHSRIDSLWGFYGVWALLGVALAGTLYTPVFAVVTRRYPHDFRRAIIVLTFLGGLASTVFIPLTNLLIDQFGWRHALWALAALQIGVCAPLHFVVLRPVLGAAPGAAGAHAGPRDAGAAAPTRVRDHLRSPAFIYLALFIVLTMAVTSALPAHMVSLLREAGLPEAWAIAIPASIGAIQVLGRTILYFFERRFDVHRANLVIPCLIPIGFTALLAALSLGVGHASVGGAGSWAIGLALAFVVFYGLGNGMLTIVKGTAIAQYVSREHVATLNGALGVPLALARSLAPWLMGVLWAPALGYRVGLAVMLGASGLAIVSMQLAQRSARAQA